MRKFLITLFWMPLLAPCIPSVQAQTHTRLLAHTDTVWLSEHKTTNITFDSPIAHVDRGSADILVQRSAVAPDLLQLKAAQEGFTQTNLSVLCGDGVLHHFSVGYERNPASHLLRVASAPGASPEEPAATPLDRYRTHALQALQRIDPSVQLEQTSKQISIVLKGIFVQQDQMYFHFILKNSSYIPFDISRFMLSIRDAKRTKRTAFQEIEIRPLLVLGDIRRLASRASVSLVVVTDKITLHDGKRLHLQIAEDRGARHQQFTIKNKHLLKAIPLLNY